MIVTQPELIAQYTTLGWWGQDTLDAVFRQNCAANPQRTALVDPPNRSSFTDGETLRLSYAELNALVNRAAETLLDCGVVKNDIVAMQMPNVHELVVALLGCSRIGAIASPILIQFDRNEINQIVQQLEPTVFLTVNRFKGRQIADTAEAVCEEHGCTLVRVNEDPRWQRVPGTIPGADAVVSQRLQDYCRDNPIDANDVLTICWTSGTEGAPKGVMRSHNQWLATGRMMREGSGLEDGDVLLNTRPLVNMAAIGGSFCSWLLSSGTMVLHHPLDMQLAVNQIREERVNLTFMPPAFIVALLKDEDLRKSADLSSLRAMGSGSAAIPSWALEAFEKEYDVKLINFFGSNEGIGLVSTAAEIPDPVLRATYFPRFGRDEFQWPSVPTSAQMKSRLVDLDTGEEITEPGKVGELRMKGSTIFSRYHKSDKETQAAFDEKGFYCSGDLFVIAGEGELSRYYQFVGRSKEVIIRGGFNIAPAELDGLLSDHPAIQEVAAFGYPDDRLGEIVGVAVVPRAGQQVSLEEIVEFLKSKDIAVFKLPQKLLVLEKLPRNGLLKVLRWQLTSLAQEAEKLGNTQEKV